MDQNERDDEQRDPLDQPSTYHHVGEDPLDLLVAAEGVTPQPPSIMPDDLAPAPDSPLKAAAKIMRDETSQAAYEAFIDAGVNELRREFGIDPDISTEDGMWLASLLHDALAVAWESTSATAAQAAELIAYEFDLPVHARWQHLGPVPLADAG